MLRRTGGSRPVKFSGEGKRAEHTGLGEFAKRNHARGGGRSTALRVGGVKLGMQFATLAARVLAIVIAMAMLALAGLRMALSDQIGSEMATADPASTAEAASERDRRLAEKGMTAGSPILIRIFEAEFEL